MSEQSMVERLAASQAAYDGRGDLSAMPAADRKRYRERALLFLHDIRKPTETMAIAGRAKSLYPAQTWVLMADAALKED